MDFTLTGRIGAVAVKSFTGKDGEEVNYQEVYFQYEDEDGNPSVVQVNTKQDMIAALGTDGVMKINVNEQGKKKLVSFLKR